PYLSQIAVLPFLAAVEGLLRERAVDSRFRVTLHRIMTWEGNGYFQQLCTYLGSAPKDQTTGGRMLPVTTGIIGYAFEHKKIARTKRYKSEAALLADLAIDMKKNNEKGDPKHTPPSYLAVPFVGVKGEVVLVLYADCSEFNFFADDKIIRTV